jgi:hypothetical protein
MSRGVLGHIQHEAEGEFGDRAGEHAAGICVRDPAADEFVEEQLGDAGGGDVDPFQRRRGTPVLLQGG